MSRPLTIPEAQARLKRLLLAGEDTSDARAELKHLQAAEQAKASADDAAAKHAADVRESAASIVSAAHARVAKSIMKFCLEG